MPYKFEWWDEFAVECPELDAFMEEFVALCRKHGIAFEMEDIGEGSGRLVPIPFDETKFGQFVDALERYKGGIPWLDEAWDKYRAVKQAIYAEDKKKAEAAREVAERAEFQRLKRKFGPAA